MRGLKIKIKRIFDPYVCPMCGSNQFTEKIDGNLSNDCAADYAETITCDNCYHTLGQWNCGYWDSPWFHLESKWQRFKYLFFGSYGG